VTKYFEKGHNLPDEPQIARDLGAAIVAKKNVANYIS
jgi:hypothetical protein